MLFDSRRIHSGRPRVRREINETAARIGAPSGGSHTGPATVRFATMRPAVICDDKAQIWLRIRHSVERTCVLKPPLYHVKICVRPLLLYTRTCLDRDELTLEKTALHRFAHRVAFLPDRKWTVVNVDEIVGTKRDAREQRSSDREKPSPIASPRQEISRDFTIHPRFYGESRRSAKRRFLLFSAMRIQDRQIGAPQ